ncbi:IclR family transcriptional regulator domain-containing protein [Paraburkholderia acidisoli]|uniref:Helix-turn-helix domain-containing protein n=1 Tax=Paraburkholderia acidisoli TaxID=2571748 RepID=A0A7Z2GP91_9BURK|nr:IclR family transcriptional regulator C-terminal domain-containing protein [Paraburkholderia acidisoli]QGZ65415.1 helix-turn-helix domain-containing protein [Paraburkholderia acidisoli]
MPSYEPIGALLRGLEVLHALNDRGPQTIGELHGVTGISKPTLVRIVETLQHAGYVNAGDAQRRYAVTPRVLGLANGYEPQRWLMDVAGPLLDAFRGAAGWPVELGVFDGDAMVILNTSREPGFLSVNRKPGSRVPLLRTALGRAFVAHLPADRRAAVIAQLATRGDSDFALARDTHALDALVATVAQRGYAIADQETLSNGRALAVPVLVRGEPIASVNLVVHSSAMTMSELEAKWSGKLIALGNEIAAQIHR